MSTNKFFQKAAAFCAYQERCISEVREKLYEWEVSKEDIESILERLEAEKYLDEERFAKTYAGGKFRTKKWGKLKIKHLLKQKGISSSLITKGLQEIDPEQYYETLQALAKQKKESMKSKYDKAKVYQFLVSKGFESDLIREVIQEL